MIEIKGLNLYFQGKQILKNLDFSHADKGCVSIMGKSGSGKSMFGKSLIRLFDDEFTMNAKKFIVFTHELLSLNEEELREYRSNTCSLVFQNSKASFHPLLDVGEHFLLYLKGRVKEPKKMAFEYFERFGFRDANLLWHKFAYELSGGEASRVQIALALCLKPKILVCDEITSDLDVKNQMRIIEILKTLKKEMAIIFITHQKELSSLIEDERYTMKDKRLEKC